MNNSTNIILAGNPMSNNASNFTGESYPITGLGMKIGMTMVYTLTFIVGLLGNSIGMYVVYKRTCITSVTNLFIANMAFADLMVTLLAIPTSIADLYIGNEWIAGTFGNLTCKVTHFSLYVSLAASVLTIVLISVERYIAIFFPLRGDIVRRPKVMTGLIWGMSCCYALPILIMFTTERDAYGNYFCLAKWPWAGDWAGDSGAATSEVLKNFFVTSFVALYIFPVLFLSGLYTLISVKLCARTSPEPEATPESPHSSVRTSRKKVVKLLIGIVVVFSVCWLPSHVMHYLIIYQTHLYFRIQNVAIVSFWLCQANSSINPCLYVFLNDTFRQDFGKTVLNIFRSAKKGFCFGSCSCKRRRHRHRYKGSSSVSQSPQRKLSFIHLLHAVRGTFSTPSGRLSGETRLTRISLTGMNQGKVAVDTRF